MLAGVGLRSVRKGTRVVCSRDRVASSRISDMTAGIVYSVSACAIRVDMAISFLIRGPVSRTRLWMGFVVGDFITGGAGEAALPAVGSWTAGA